MCVRHCKFRKNTAKYMDSSSKGEKGKGDMPLRSRQLSSYVMRQPRLCHKSANCSSVLQNVKVRELLGYSGSLNQNFQCNVHALHIVRKLVSGKWRAMRLTIFVDGSNSVNSIHHSSAGRSEQELFT